MTGDSISLALVLMRGPDLPHHRGDCDVRSAITLGSAGVGPGRYQHPLIVHPVFPCCEIPLIAPRLKVGERARLCELRPSRFECSLATSKVPACRPFFTLEFDPGRPALDTQSSCAFDRRAELLIVPAWIAAQKICRQAWQPGKHLAWAGLSSNPSRWSLVGIKQRWPRGTVARQTFVRSAGIVRV